MALKENNTPNKVYEEKNRTKRKIEFGDGTILLGENPSGIRLEEIRIKLSPDLEAKLRPILKRIQLENEINRVNFGGGRFFEQTRVTPEQGIGNHNLDDMLREGRMNREQCLLEKNLEILFPDNE